MGNIYITGDIHGSPGEIRLRIAQIENPTKDDIIIICGDAGFEYTSKYIMGEAKKVAAKFPGTWVVVRGNHDSRYWREHAVLQHHGDKLFAKPDIGWEITDDKSFLYQKKYPNIKYVRDDGGIYTIGGYNFLFVPGAYSVDKEHRIKNALPWVEDEQLTPHERLKLLEIVTEYNHINKPIDFVVGHTFPISLEPYYKYLFLDFIDQSSVDKTTDLFLQTLRKNFEDNSNFKHYFGGHFHDDKELTSQYTMLYHDVVNIKDYL